MAHIHEAILALNSSVVTIRGNVAYNANEQVVQYDLEAAEIKLAQMQEEEAQAIQAAKDAKTSALAKLSALGLTEAEVKALIG